ncbi:ComF family protein [Salinimicrobium sp. GXAS 041]|uniref:ComF family protein n=1 Tax=Salinimicrobium sp. GXAS 041 TaxID=3400806 RepID=UPI003C74BF68
MFHDLLELLYPQVCHTCEAVLLSNEKVVCTRCIHELPVTNFHLEKENEVEKIFYGRVKLEYATSLLLFEKKGMVQQLIHNLKYKGHEEIGDFLGTWLGEDLHKIENYKQIDVVIPVPLHKSKLRKRGYNQVEKFGRAIAHSLEIPYEDSVLVKKTASSTQTIKKRFARWGSIESTFLIENAEKVAHQHILLVDDLVTTGATLEACALKLLNIPGVKVSIATMAVTH